MRNFYKRLVPSCDRAAMVLLCVLMADCCIFGSGRLIEFGSIGFRMALLFVPLLVSLPLMLSKLRGLLRSPFLWMLAAFALWLAVCTVMGIRNGNSRTILAADLKGFAYFALLPAALCILSSRQRVYTLMRVMMYASLALALLHVAYLIVHLSSSSLYYSLYSAGLSSNFSRIGTITSKIPRLFFNSEMYLLCGCAFPMYFYVRGERKRFYPAMAGLCLFAILLSYTRSVYLGAFLAAVGCVLALALGGSAQDRKRLGIFLAVAVLIFSCITCAFSLTQDTEYFGFGLTRTLVSLQDPDETEATEPSETTPEETDAEQIQQDAYITQTISSDQLRAETMAELLAHIQSSPIIGLGLGAGLSVRGDGEGFNEYFYLDLWAKTGLIGLILYLLPVFWMGWTWLRSREKRSVCKAVWLSVLLGFLAFSFFNPYMNASLGVLMYCCVMAVFAVPGEAVQAQNNT
ncbi:MAG: O-antigen ligase family protein [Firmicutes bacterium]|nr:O-antigen ligase family protein [Bacillota bacterium]